MLAAACIDGFRKILSHVASVAPLRRSVTAEDLGNTAHPVLGSCGRHHRRNHLRG
jgi:enoyl-[acyl-carrier-protein] reductase (NADH)